VRPPLFLLLGDAFLCDEKRKEIISLLEKEFGLPLPVTVLRAGERPVASLLLEARTLPFLARAQVFCLREADQFGKNDLALWKDYFKSPHPESFFIFEAGSLEKAHPFQEWAGRARQLFFLEPQSGRIVAHFIREKLKQAQKQITPEAQELLESKVGESFLLLDSFLDQLILYSGEKQEIDPAAVAAFDEPWAQGEGEDFVGALAEKNIPQALQVLHYLVEQNFRDFPSVVGLLHWQLRRFWEAKTWLAEGETERRVALRLRLSPSRAAGFFRQLGRFSREELAKILEGLFDLDWRLKSGRAEGRWEIESWLIKTLGD